MKIIFDSKKQYTNFLNNRCPHDLCSDFTDSCDNYIYKDKDISCDECFRKFIKIEIKNSHKDEFDDENDWK